MPTLSPEIESASKNQNLTSPKLAVLLENIRSAFNVGSIIRTCDSAGVDQLYFAGYTPIPPHPKLGKTALGSAQHINWQHLCSPLEAARHINSVGYQLVACEPGEDSQNIYKVNLNQPSCLIFGHEESGVSQELLDLAQLRLQIPQLGQKTSLNVAVAAGICVYEARRQLSFATGVN